MTEEHHEFDHVVGAFSGKTFNYLDMLAGKRSGFIEVVVNNNGPHAVVGDFPSLRGIEHILCAAAPAGKVLRPNVMVPLLGFEVFTRHDCPFRCVLGRKVSAWLPPVKPKACLRIRDERQ